MVEFFRFARVSFLCLCMYIGFMLLKIGPFFSETDKNYSNFSHLTILTTIIIKVIIEQTQETSRKTIRFPCGSVLNYH